MRTSSLAERFLDRIADIARRSDVTVHRLDVVHLELPRAWASILPDDMRAFYETVNGCVFDYTCEGSPAWHGINLHGLSRRGETFDHRARARGLSRRPASAFGPRFFQPGELEPTDDVLFFAGASDAAGLLLVGAGASASFREWDNDGFARPLGPSFTALLERAIESGFAFGQCDHPSGAAHLRAASPPRATFHVRVVARSDESPAAFRERRASAWRPGTAGTIARHLGQAKAFRDVPADERLRWLGALCGEGELTSAKRTTAMKELAGNAATAAQFDAYFARGATSIAVVTLEVEHAGDPLPSALTARQLPDFEARERAALLTRVLHDVDGLRVTSAFPGEAGRLRLRETHWDRYSPFASLESELLAPGAARFTVALDAARAVGLVEGATFRSTALVEPL